MEVDDVYWLVSMETSQLPKRRLAIRASEFQGELEPWNLNYSDPF
jgi:hypothetical protein|tara:strand:+ start:105 stop:239 length:135 start_codon:yes stop_codon:yes gene_type:complete